jgi:hypothetical protein
MKVIHTALVVGLTRGRLEDLNVGRCLNPEIEVKKGVERRRLQQRGVGGLSTDGLRQERHSRQGRNGETSWVEEHLERRELSRMMDCKVESVLEAALCCASCFSTL